MGPQLSLGFERLVRTRGYKFIEGHPKRVVRFGAAQDADRGATNVIQASCSGETHEVER